MQSNDKKEPDPFEGTRRKLREFMTKQGIPEEHQDVFEPYAMAAATKMAAVDAKAWVKEHPRTTMVAGLGLTLAGFAVLFVGIRALNSAKDEKPDLKAV